jgi:hypothetical protein
MPTLISEQDFIETQSGDSIIVKRMIVEEYTTLELKAKYNAMIEAAELLERQIEQPIEDIIINIKEDKKKQLSLIRDRISNIEKANIKGVEKYDGEVTYNEL